MSTAPSMRLRHRMLGWLIATGLAGIAGCAAGPSYHRPTVALPDGYETVHDTSSGTGAPPDLAVWWQALGDPELNSLVERAVRANPDLEIAVDRLQAARTFESGVIGRALPAIGASAGGGHGTGADLARSRASPVLSGADDSRGLNHVNELAGFDAVWEIDVFGRLRRERQAAGYATAQAFAARDGALVSVVADVVRAYVDLRGLQLRAAILRRGVDVLGDSDRLAGLRYRRGITNELDAVLATRELATLRASLAPIEAEVRAAEYAIATLLGERPEVLIGELDAPGLVPVVPATLEPGLPLDLLRRRPDVREAEWALAGATARIGIATANLFPRLALTGALGAQRQALGTTPVVGQHLWSFGAGAVWPLLDFGALDAQVEVADLETHALLINYRRRVEEAVQGVDTAAVGLAAQRERLARLDEALMASERAVELAKARYERGLTDYLNVIDAERQAYVIEGAHVEAQVAVGEQFVALYKSLGGGWEHYQDLPAAYRPKPAIVATFTRLLGPDRSPR